MSSLLRLYARNLRSFLTLFVPAAEFKLHTSQRERKSAPPLKQPDFSGIIKARALPDFGRISFKPEKSQADLTVPVGFQLESLKRHEQARELQRERKEEREQLERDSRVFKSKAVPDYDSKAICIMPSDRPLTVPVKPAFASDALPKKAKKVSPAKTNEPKDFVF